MAAKAKAKSDGAEKVEKAEKVPKSPVKSPKSKKDGVKNAPMKKKAGKHFFTHLLPMKIIILSIEPNCSYYDNFNVTVAI